MKWHKAIWTFSVCSMLGRSLCSASYPPLVPGQLWLTVRETAGVARTGEVVRSGIPLPRSLNLRDPGTLTIVGSNGVPVPAQFQVLARWNAGLTNPASPIQWLLVTFPASVSANSSVSYRVVTDGSAGTNPPTARPINLLQQGNRVIVDTGAATFTIDGDAGALFSAIGLAGGQQQVVNGGALTAQAVTYTPLPVTNAATYSTVRRVYVEHQGPLAAIVVVEGAYNLPLAGGGALATRLRYVFTAGSPTAIVRHVATWEGDSCGLGNLSCTTGTNTFPNGIRLQRLQDALTLNFSAPLAVTAAGERGKPALLANLTPGETAWVRQQLRANRTNALSYDVNVAGQTAAGAQATSGLLCVSSGTSALALALDHMHRYEPQALRVLSDGRVAVNVADDQVWLGARQGLFATLAVAALSNNPAISELDARVWAPLNHPLRAWPTPEWFAASQAVDEVPVGALPGNLALYDRLVPTILSNTLTQVDAKGLAGLQTFGLYPRNWADPTLSDELDNQPDTDPTPNETWDDLYWGATWTDYHNTTATAPIWAMRSGEVQWLDEIATPAAWRMLHTQIVQGAPGDTFFYIGQAPTGYGGYRADFNSSHAYFENLLLYYWLTGDYTVVETLQRGAYTMRDYLCSLRPDSPCGPTVPPTDEFAGLSGRVASQWNAVFRFVGLAGDDASFLDDFKASMARAITQYYVEASQGGVNYGFWLSDPVTLSGTNSTSQLWMISFYDMNSLYRLLLDTDDAPLGQPPVSPSRVLATWARTLARFGPTTATAPPFDASANCTFYGNWPNTLDFVWSGNRLGGTLSAVTAHYDPAITSDNYLYDTTKALLSGVLARASDLTGEPGLAQLAGAAAVRSLAAAWADGSPLPLGKPAGEFMGSLHAAVARLAASAPAELRLGATLCQGAPVLSWPAVPANVVLESTASLQPPVAWSAVAVPQYQASWSVDSTVTNHQYFRLRAAAP